MKNQEAEAIYGLYPDAERAEAAVRRLMQEGVSEDSIELISPEPIDDPTLLPKRKVSRMPWLAALGGLLGCIGATLLVVGTQRAYPIPTGKMPIVSTWANGVVIFELMMMGIIITTVLVFLFTARLPERNGKLYDPAVSEGKFLVGVLAPPNDERPRLETLLREAGSETIKSVPA